MKKILLLMLCMILLVGTVSAFEFDNVGRDYNKTTQTIIIKNAFGLGDDIAKVKLDTPLVNNVFDRGENIKQVVAEFTIDNLRDYNNVINNLEFYNVRNGLTKFNREFEYRYKVYYNVNVSDYKNVCKERVVFNGTEKYDCVKEEVGSHIEQKFNWVLLDDKLGLDKGNITIGIFTDVFPNERIEWIPTLFGVKINQWAEWTVDLNNGLMFYFTFNESTGNTSALDIRTSLHNATLTGTPAFVSGLIGNAIDWVGSASQYGNITNLDGINISEEFTFSLYARNHDQLARQYCATNWFSGGPFIFGLFENAGWRFLVRNSSNSVEVRSGAIIDEQWYHVVVGYNGTDAYMYLDGVLIADVESLTGLLIELTSGGIVIGADDPPSSEQCDATIDEFAGWNRSLTLSEILDLNSTITYDPFPQGVTTTLISPIDFFNSSLSSIEFSVNSTPKSVNLTNVTLNIWYSNGTSFTTNTTTLSGNETVTTNWTISSIPNGNNFTWNAFTEGTLSVSDWGDSNFTFSVDSTSPSINVTDPRETFDFGSIGQNLSVNWSVSDANLDSCWFNYNSTNTTVTCADNNYSFITTTQKNLTFYANDTLGNQNSNFTSWDFKVLEINQTFNNETLEGATETFTLNIQTNGLTVTLANFSYNDTLSTGTILNQGDNNFKMTEILVIPGVDVETNQTFFWNLILSDSTVVNSTENNQTVNIISLDDCSVNTNLIFNYTIRDEGNQSVLINTSVGLNIDLFDSGRISEIFNFSKEYLEINPVQVCLSGSLFSNTNFSIDSIVQYTATNYVIEYFNIVDFILTNSTIPQNINLFSLLSADSTDFKITFKDSSFVPVENALVFIDRQYIIENNTFKTVELPKTDSNGETVGHFVRNDVIYNIRVVKDGEVLGNFENVIAFCQDITIENCQINLNALSTIENLFNYDESVGLIFENPTFDNSTNLVSFEFLTSDGSAKTITMEVTRSDIFGNISICNTSLTSSSGTLSCEVPSGIDETTLIIEVFIDGVLAVAGSVLLSSSTFGNIGYIVWFIFTLALMLMLGDDKTRLLISLVISYIGAVALSLSDGTIIGLASTGIWIIVVTMVGIWKLNKDNPQ